MSVNSQMVTVSSKGRIIIPAPLRKRLGLKPGMKVLIREEKGKIVLTPQMEDPVEELFGKLAGEDSLVDALLKERVKEKNREMSKIRTG